MKRFGSSWPDFAASNKKPHKNQTSDSERWTKLAELPSVGPTGASAPSRLVVVYDEWSLSVRLRPLRFHHERSHNSGRENASHPRRNQSYKKGIKISFCHDLLHRSAAHGQGCDAARLGRRGQ